MIRLTKNRRKSFMQHALHVFKRMGQQQQHFKAAQK